MKTSQKGIDLIKSFEGTKLKAYKCSAGIATIGIGTTRYPNGNSVKIGDTCTLEQAETYLKHDLERFEDSVNRLVGLKIHQFMYDSLVSFAYNLGAGALQSSTLLKKVNLGKFKEASEEFLKWDRAKVKGVSTKIAGLTRRRESEKSLFLQGFKELEINEITENK